MRELEVNAKTVDEAIRLALEKLGVSRDQVEVTVLKRGRGGVLGMGAEEASIKVRLLSVSDDETDAVEVAREVLEALMKSMKIAGNVSVIPSTSADMAATLDIEGDDLGVLIGRRGQTLSSLQYVVRLLVAERLKRWVPINVDVAGYRKRRYDSLRSLALRLAEQVKRNRRSITLEPMPADERRVIHLTLSDDPDVTTESTGEGEMRKVVILLKKH